jgi:hypothetical protein
MLKIDFKLSIDDGTKMPFLYTVDICDTAYSRPFTKSKGCLVFPFASLPSALLFVSYWIEKESNKTYRIKAVSKANFQELIDVADENTTTVTLSATNNDGKIDEDDVTDMIFVT